MSEWICCGCGSAVPPDSVTFEEYHDPRAGGCGGKCQPSDESELVRLQSSLAAAQARVAEVERERDDLAMREREVTCVWCGHQFKSTLRSQADHLYAHAKECEKHPVRALTTERDALKARLAEVERELASCSQAAKIHCGLALDWRNIAEMVERERDIYKQTVKMLRDDVRSWSGKCDILQDSCEAMREALIKAHLCATLRRDGTCDGCHVSAALALTPATVGKREEARRKVVEAAKDSENRDYVTMELRHALTALAAQERG